MVFIPFILFLQMIPVQTNGLVKQRFQTPQQATYF